MRKIIFPTQEIVDRVRKEYPAGTRVCLRRMDDVQAPPIGTFGTVTGVDDVASLLMEWDNGSCLNVIYDEDEVAKVVATTVCYGEKQEWTSRKEAKEYFFQAMMGCDSNSSECGRYAKIYAELATGLALCTDEEDGE